MVQERFKEYGRDNCISARTMQQFKDSGNSLKRAKKG